MRKPSNKLLSVVLTPEEMEELKAYCKENRISMAAYARFCIKAGYKRGIVIGDQLLDGSFDKSVQGAGE